MTNLDAKQDPDNQENDGQDEGQDLSIASPWHHKLPSEVRDMAPKALSHLSLDLLACGEADLAKTAQRLAMQIRVPFKRLAFKLFARLSADVSALDSMDLFDRRAWASYLLALAACYGDMAARKAIVALILADAWELTDIHKAWLSLSSDLRLDTKKLDSTAVHYWQDSHGVGGNDGADQAHKAPRTAPDKWVVAPKFAIGEEADQTYGQGSIEATLARYRVLAGHLPLKGNFDLDDEGHYAIINQLHGEFPWFGDVIEALSEQLVLRHALGSRSLGFRPLLLVGPPGCGKTRFAMRLSELSGCAFGAINAGGSTDNRLLAGTARGWATATPCLPAAIIAQNRCANPVILVDEIDKTSTDPRNGRLVHTLLSMLETTSAKAWPDECLVTPLDLSHVSWIVTANEIDNLEAPLLSRLDVHHVRGPEAAHFEALVTAILADVAEEFHQDVEDLPMLTPQTIGHLKAGFAKSPSPRALRRAISVALAHALRPPHNMLN